MSRLRKAFNEYENSVSIPTARRATLIVAAFVLGGTLMDWQVFPEKLWQFLLIRASAPWCWLSSIWCWVRGRNTAG
jgi:hypothetical protein